MLAPYPVYEKEYDDPVVVNQYEQIIAAVKVTRSLLDAYGIKEHAQSNVVNRIELIELVKLQVKGPALMSLFDEQLQSISQLIGTKKIANISVIEEPAEEGYAVSSVNSEVNVLLLVKVWFSMRKKRLTSGSCGSHGASSEDRREVVEIERKIRETRGSNKCSRIQG